ncbi:hypothetical protein FA95DRAFT_1312677 [Auriscalpium vulgare]|uniref:Uncharacterized protein n=1 Tax=Auriscalpium vulgare TaxID=40419 RepID=A0ACB8RRW1_9AGAM|nr:hypothetical protein FA95DRAFT_1312677 [Auriscalpium vulgare]
MSTIHACGRPNCDKDGLKRCSGCAKVWYCGQECQRWDWVAHIFHCNPGRPITTADHLALAVDRNFLPEDEQTCADYGFTRAFTPQNQGMLLGLYIGLIEHMGTKPKTVHRWRVQGTLIKEIKATLSKLPEGARGGYYPWFLEHQYVLDQSKAPPASPQELADAAVKRAWVFTGGSSAASMAEILEAEHSEGKDRSSCYQLYRTLLSGWHPSPSMSLWVSFGFCATKTMEEEEDLGVRYMTLIHSCTFDEFCTAYESGSLPTLFRSKDQPLPDQRVIDLLSNHISHPSVWNLKQFILQVEQNPNLRPPRSVSCDYGFMNCTSSVQTQDLINAYKCYFEHAKSDPLELHQAAIKGELAQYVGTFVVLKPRKKFVALMKNPYPLREY